LVRYAGGGKYVPADGVLGTLNGQPKEQK
jgi:hypothetical protein